MLKAISPFLFLLGILGISDAQYGACDYVQYIEAGKSYDIFNPGYPQYNYNGGENCRWTAQSNRPIKMTCDTFSIPKSDNCNLDEFSIKSDNTEPHRYCGKGRITVASDNSNQIIATLNSPLGSPGGKFLCKIQTIDENYDCACGRQNPTRIVGGKETGINEYTMVAGLIDSKLRFVYCGATIINNRQVLTAAHCIGKRDISMISVLIGEHDLSTNRETNATRLLKAIKIAVHPQYSAVTMDYDMAIITVDNIIEFNEFIGPVCLPFQHSPDTFGGNYVEVLGWGTTEFSGAPSNTLQKVDLSVLTNGKCRKTYPEIGTRQLCTAAVGKDSCQYDSGGPVLWKDPSTKRLVVIGIISRGLDCGGDSPSVNTRVGAFIKWILSQAPSNGFEYCEIE